MSIFNKILKKTNEILYTKICSNIRSTDPLEYNNNPEITVVSMIGHSTLDMYLVAIKSFIIFFVDANIEVINDGTLTENDRKILSYHVPRIVISNGIDVKTGTCPDYSSWKRLFRIIDISRSSYVIQLDSDTITIGPLVEIYSKAAINEGFMIGESHWSQSIDLYHMQCIARRWNATGPQGFSEKILHELPFFEKSDKYLHGCAGFAGYPKGSLSPELVEDLSKQIEQKIGRENWRQWGSEQAISNCLISKSKNSTTLPWPKYRNHMFPPTGDPFEAASFIHFIGTHRFSDSVYKDATKRFLNHYNDLR